MFSKNTKSKKLKNGDYSKKSSSFLSWLGIAQQNSKKSSSDKKKRKSYNAGSKNNTQKEIKSLNMRQELLAGEVKRQREEIFEIKEHIESLENIVSNIKSANPVKNNASKEKHGAGTPDAGLEKALASRIDDIILTSPSSSFEETESNLPDDDDMDMFSDTVVGELLHDAIRHNRLEVFAQPVVSLPQRKIIAFELLTRIRARAGLYLPASRYINLAKEEDLIEILDNALLLNCLKFIKNNENSKDSTPFFLNITEATLKDAGFMNALLPFLKENKEMAGKIVFEMSQKEYSRLSGKLSDIVLGLAKIGCRFSMDQITKPQIDMKTMRKYHVEFLKIHAEHLMLLSKSDDGLKRLRNMVKGLNLAKINLIVDYVESENQIRELLDVDIAFGQGYLFGRPEHEMTFKLSKKKFA